MTKAKLHALLASAYNLHVRKGEPMTPATAAKLPKGDKAALCRLLETKGGSEIYTADDAKAAFAMVVLS